MRIPDQLSALTNFEARCLDIALGRELAGYGFTMSDTPTDYARVIVWILGRLQNVERRGHRRPAPLRSAEKMRHIASAVG